MPHFHHAAVGSFQSVFLSLILVFTALVYLCGWLSPRSGLAGSRRVEHISAWRAIGFFAGLFLIWAAVASPFAVLDHELLTVHMLQHLLLMTVAPPLIWLAKPISTLLHWLPRRWVEKIFAFVAPFRHSPAFNTFVKALGSAECAWLAACGALVVWHVPIFFALGMQSASWHLFEQTSFLATGLLFWRPVFQAFAQSTPGESRKDFSMILYLFFATLPCDILSGFLAFSERVVYPIYFSSSHLLGFSALVDQQCAAALMWTGVTFTYFVAGAILTMRLLSPDGISQLDFVQSKSCGAVTSRCATDRLEVF